MPTTAIDVFERLPAYDRSMAADQKKEVFDLSRFQKFLDRIRNPEKGLPVIHVTGSKGKGSISALIGSGLQALGKNVGVFISPYLHSPLESIFVGGQPISIEKFSVLMNRYQAVIDRLPPSQFVTGFEVLTAIALQHFHDEDVDFAVMETGLGGRLDATNVIESPVISIIGAIEKEHSDILGGNITSVAFEKLGIVREDTPVIIAPQKDLMIADFIKTYCLQKPAPCLSVRGTYESTVLDRSANGYSFRLNAPTRTINRIQLALTGEHQIENAMTAWAVLDQLMPDFDQEQVLETWSYLTLPGRFETRIKDGRELILDGAHTPESAIALRKTLDDVYGGEPITFMISFLNDKNVEGVIRNLVRWGDAVVFTQVDHPRSLPARLIEARVKDFLNKQKVTYAITNNLRIAWQKVIKMSSRSPICVTGSFKLIEKV
jgi:dihydrofolate synthase / folylpolyglutamate synthase